MMPTNNIKQKNQKSTQGNDNTPNTYEVPRLNENVKLTCHQKIIFCLRCVVKLYGDDGMECKGIVKRM